MRLDTHMSQRMDQRMILAPRMIQSMEILQLPIMALQERIQQELQENPVLELKEDTADGETEAAPAEDQDEASNPERELVIDDTGNNEIDFDRLEALNKDWEDHFNEGHRPSRNGIDDEIDKKHDAMQNMPSRPQSLHDYLTEQLTFLDAPPDQMQLLRYLITHIDDNGYLSVPLDEVARSYPLPVTTEQLEEVLRMLQKLEPPGIGARDLKECLLLQLTPETLHRDVVRALILNHLEDIQHNRLPVIQRRTGYDLTLIKDAIEVLKHLNPKPGARFTADNIPYVVPDIVVERTEDGEYEVRLLDDWTPNIYISRRYMELYRDKSADPKAKEYLKRKIQAAQWLMESIEQRRSTLEKVTRAIIKHQRAFLDKGPEHIEPLKMQQIADQVGVHVTTVSRAVDDKWVQTPRGIFPLKRFFGGGTHTATGEEVAWETIKQKLLEIIDKEDKANPWSDEDLVAKLQEAGYPVARRTVTKYRKMLNIPSSRQRKDWTQTAAAKRVFSPLTMQHLSDEIRRQEAIIREGGGAKAIARQHEKGRLTARERIARLIDPDAPFFELGLWAAWGMYTEWGGAPSAGVVTGIGRVAGRRVMVIANDATVKAGAFFPMTCKKVLRAQRIAMDNRLPLVYLVDSAGVFLPLQDEVFPDEDDFGRIFRNNAVISAAGIPQFAAILGNCVAGGGYLPVLCDKLLMTEGSGLYLAGPALVKAAIGQNVSHEELGGAAMHAAVSGTIDFREPDEPACLARLRRLIDALPADRPTVSWEHPPGRPAADVFEVAGGKPRQEYDMRDLLPCFLDAGPFDEYKAEYGQTLVCGYGRLGGVPVGVVANQRRRCRPLTPNPSPPGGEGLGVRGPIQYGGVIYVDSADKAARFIMDCNQTRVPLIFLQDVNGFMVGRDSEQAGIIRAGAKLVNVIANSVVPKITVILGGSFGAGNYALCGKAFDPRFLFAWPGARYAVMGGEQAASTLLDITVTALKRSGHEPDAEELEELRRKVQDAYDEHMDIRYGAARLWVDRILDPAETRTALLLALEVATRYDDGRPFKTGVLQV